jgi:cytochrome c553
VLRSIVLLALIAAGSGSAALDWILPVGTPSQAPVWDTVTPRTLPGSSAHFTDAQLHDRNHAVDWRPNEHPALPPSVAVGAGAANACGFCHLPDGAGRPENAALAGLSADYIREQVEAFASGERAPLDGKWAPSAFMGTIAKAADAKAVREAADYFSRLRFTSHVRVVERAQIARAVPLNYVYSLDTTKTEPIGTRIVEVPETAERFEMRDTHLLYTAYVPPGAVAAGMALAQSGGPAGQPCALCHGVGLKGGIAPPLAGRSPSFLARQLFGFRAGTRGNTAAAPMRMVAEQLSDRNIIDLAAYAGSRRP